jgi:hypothetical protein
MACTFESDLIQYIIHISHIAKSFGISAGSSQSLLSIGWTFPMWAPTTLQTTKITGIGNLTNPHLVATWVKSINKPPDVLSFKDTAG